MKKITLMLTLLVIIVGFPKSEETGSFNISCSSGGIDNQIIYDVDVGSIKTEMIDNKEYVVWSLWGYSSCVNLCFQIDGSAKADYWMSLLQFNVQNSGYTSTRFFRESTVEPIRDDVRNGGKRLYKITNMMLEKHAVGN